MCPHTTTYVFSYWFHTHLHTEADKAKEKMMQEKLQREKLAGDKDVAGKNYESESAAYKLTISPYEREIYVITVCALPRLSFF